MKRSINLLILFLDIGANLHAQYPYTLQQCLEEGLMNNYSLRISRNEEQISKIMQHWEMPGICLP